MQVYFMKACREMIVLILLHKLVLVMALAR